MNILFASGESVPFCKTGGLADVVGALSNALQTQRQSVLLILPFYQTIKKHFPKIKYTGRTLQIPFAGGMETVQLWEWRERSSPRVVFIGSHYFDRNGLYGDPPGSTFEDNDRRYILFGKAVLEAARAVGFKPDIIHCHDWQTGLIPAYLKFLFSHDPFFESTAAVFTIHNMAYQGNFPSSTFLLTDLPWNLFQPNGAEFYGQVSFLKSGLVYSDGVNTVSPTYAHEISTFSHFGCGMEGVLQNRKERFRGILNGLDTKVWNPESDQNLAVNFNKTSFKKRSLCKRDLQAAAGLPVDSDIPLLGFIGRLDHQKGIDLLVEILPALLKEGVQFVSLGQGHPNYVLALNEIARRYPSQVYIETAFAEAFAHKIYAGVDLFLMPSRFEPCGLGQLIAMRYGAVPVVTPTGGLLDTVTNIADSKSTGFISADLTAGAFLDAVNEGLKWRRRTKPWQELQKRGMSKDFSWKGSVKKYLSFYEAALQWKSR